MICKFGPGIDEQEQSIFRSVLTKFPEYLQAGIFKNDGPRYTVWMTAGMHGNYYIFQPSRGLLTMMDTETITAGAYYAEKVIQASMQGQPSLSAVNDPNLTADEAAATFLKKRLDDFRRTMTASELERRLNEGTLAGLEFMKGRL